MHTENTLYSIHITHIHIERLKMFTFLPTFMYPIIAYMNNLFAYNSICSCVKALSTYKLYIYLHKHFQPQLIKRFV